ncbi:MAG: TerD family protein [Pyrinomonadaceae bacterium]|nr:TerD family protein [Pyrinomonadaceae bacterium]
MAINLTKGQRIEIGLQKVGVGLGWDPNDANGGDFDLDASAFLLGKNGKLPTDNHFIFYNNKISPDGAVVGADDDQTGGSSDGDDETITVDLANVSPEVQEIMFTVSIHEYESRRQNFGQVRNSFIRIYNAADNSEIAKYELDEDFSTETALEFGRLYRKDGAWKFEAIGKGYQGGLAMLVNKYQ